MIAFIIGFFITFLIVGAIKSAAKKESRKVEVLIEQQQMLINKIDLILEIQQAKN